MLKRLRARGDSTGDYAEITQFHRTKVSCQFGPASYSSSPARDDAAIFVPKAQGADCESTSKGATQSCPKTSRHRCSHRRGRWCTFVSGSSLDTRVASETLLGYPQGIWPEFHFVNACIAGGVSCKIGSVGTTFSRSALLGRPLTLGCELICGGIGRGGLHDFNLDRADICFLWHAKLPRRLDPGAPRSRIFLCLFW